VVKLVDPVVEDQRAVYFRVSVSQTPALAYHGRSY
jgi:hypothetical protein